MRRFPGTFGERRRSFYATVHVRSQSSPARPSVPDSGERPGAVDRHDGTLVVGKHGSGRASRRSDPDEGARAAWRLSESDGHDFPRCCHALRSVSTVTLQPADATTAGLLLVALEDLQDLRFLSVDRGKGLVDGTPVLRTPPPARSEPPERSVFAFRPQLQHQIGPGHVAPVAKAELKHALRFRQSCGGRGAGTKRSRP